jgi:hypothetical protein
MVAEEYKTIVKDKDEEDTADADQKVEKRKGCCFGFCFDGNTMAKGITTVVKGLFWWLLNLLLVY